MLSFLLHLAPFALLAFPKLVSINYITPSLSQFSAQAKTYERHHKSLTSGHEIRLSLIE